MVFTSKEICISYFDAKTPGCDEGQRLLFLTPVGDMMKETLSLIRQEFPRQAKLSLRNESVKLVYIDYHLLSLRTIRTQTV